MLNKNLMRSNAWQDRGRLPRACYKIATKKSELCWCDNVTLGDKSPVRRASPVRVTNRCRPAGLFPADDPRKGSCQLFLRFAEFGQLPAFGGNNVSLVVAAP